MGAPGCPQAMHGDGGWWPEAGAGDTEAPEGSHDMGTVWLGLTNIESPLCRLHTATHAWAMAAGSGQHVATCQSQRCQCWRGRGGGAVVETEQGGGEKELWNGSGGHALSSQVPLVSSPRGTGSLWKWEGRLRLGEAPAQDPFTQAARRWSSGRRRQLLPTPWTQRNRDPLPALCRPPPCLRGPTHRSCMAATAATYNTLSLAGEGGARPEAGAWPLLCSLQSPTCTGAWQVLHWQLNGDSHETEPQTHCPVW